MSEPALGVGRGGIHHEFECVVNCLEGACVGGPQGDFELRPAILIRRQVGGIRGKIQQMSASGLDGLANSLHLMCAQIVHDDHRIERQGRPIT